MCQYSTEEQYYLNKPLYKSILQLQNIIPKTERVIGLAQFRHYYASNHLMVCRKIFGDDFRIQYAYVSDEFKNIPKMKNYLPYNYIWSDSGDFPNKIKASKIDWIKQFGEYYLIKLKQPAGSTFLLLISGFCQEQGYYLLVYCHQIINFKNLLLH